ncbi:MAG TPA: hypothetical protein VJQ54_04650, partial [Candidatus Sulfotelmatobacter sp.]|nr:hypothetical protein [Candidatus Sulfotelmatobacter sp.]
MSRTEKAQKSRREERHSAAWGKRASLAVLLITSMAFGVTTPSARANGRSSNVASELSTLLVKVKQGSAKGQTVRVIVQYKQVPT